MAGWCATNQGGGTCNSTKADFYIKNVGSGNMSDSSEFRVYYNDTLVYSHKFKVESEDSLHIQIPTHGQTIRVEADQSSYYPAPSYPRFILEACSDGFVEIDTGYVITVPQDDQEQNVSISCLDIADSYDPNDKKAEPEGLYDANYILNNDKIEYTVRFQNTGTAEAYKIVIVDTLDENFDISTLQLGSSSHTYSLDITGKGKPVMKFSFTDIMLPDSLSDPLGSIGFLKFSIRAKDGLALGTVLKNKAYIYFDYNSPIITNETIHTITENYIVDLTKGSGIQIGNQITSVTNSIYRGAFVKIYPNPTSSNVIIEKYNIQSAIKIKFYDLSGKEISSYEMNDNQSEYSFSNYSPGIYFYKVMDSDNAIIEVGKLMKQ